MNHLFIKELVCYLGFKQSNLTGTIYSKFYSAHNNYEIKIDFEKEKIEYGELIQKGDETTLNFENSENFVVFECVNRLLEKGYKPEHLFLEKMWGLGRQTKGKVDIAVKGLEDKTLLLIECKTFGYEYEKEKNKMREHGGQLFSYLQQDKNTQYICLYASTFEDNKLEYQNSIIKIKDREEDLKEIENGNNEIKTYLTANTKDELHAVWLENFEGYFFPNGLFEPEIEPYNPGLQPLKKINLKELNEDTGKGIFNQFQEILRHNNISDKSNAFNRFISLMLAKIVDETKADNEVLGFQFKIGVDTYESFQDRLQMLYVTGMKRYLKEEIIYYSDEEIEKIISIFPRQTAKKRLKDAMRQMKFYTTNEFSFKEIHNEKLFIDNSKGLVEIVKLIQDYKFKYSNKQQFLGTFFELMLNDGYKQSEGQFFTPLPIAKFIVSSIPLKEIIDNKLKSEDTKFLPTVIDYACGSGHFLTEAIEAIQTLAVNLEERYTTEINQKIASYKNSTEWASDFIYGIEKDYRLARTSQVACFLNGDGDANIIFGEGLEQHPEMNNKNGSPIQFDVLIANPPYSVLSFKQHLKIQQNDFELLSYLTNDAKQIEVLFIERMKQLLKKGEYNTGIATDGGFAGIILPNSISDSGGIYTKARELILKYFEIKAIVELGKNSFMATSIKPIILFLKRRNDYFADDRLYIAEDLIYGYDTERNLDFIDSKELLKRYVEFIGFDITDYKTLIEKKANETILQSDFYKNYKEWFENLTEIKNLKNKNTFKKLSYEEQKNELEKNFYEKVLEIEKDKFFNFLLICDQSTLIIKTGKDNDTEKEFLGYEFSERRGNEGMFPVGNAKTVDEATKLYDYKQELNPKKANYYIYKAFLEDKYDFEVDESLINHISKVDLTDIVSFENIEFDKSIDISLKAKINNETIWGLDKSKLVYLKDIATLIKGTSITKSNVISGEIPVIAGGKTAAYYHNQSNFEGKKITVSASGANAGYVWYHDYPIFASDCSVLYSKDEENFSTRLLYLFLNFIQQNVYQLQRGQAQPHVYIRDLNKILIPNIDNKLGNKIISDIEEIDKNKTSHLKGNLSVQEMENKLMELKRQIIINHLKTITINNIDE